MVKVLKRIGGVILWTVSVLCGILLLVSVLVYMPPVQRFVKDKAAAAVSSATGMKLDIGRFRLRFPLTVLLRDVSLSHPGGDTVARFERFRTRVAVVPLIRRNVILTREILLEQAAVNYSDSTMALHGHAGRLSVQGVRANLAQMSFGASRISLDSIDFEMGGATGLSIKLASGELSDCAADISAQNIEAEAVKLSRAAVSYTADTVMSATDSLPSAPWTIKVGKVDLEENSFAYGDLDLEAINLSAGSLYNRSSDISADIIRLTLRERSGLVITEGSGAVAMDSTGISVRNFELKTPSSSLSADAAAGAGIMSLQPSTTLSLRLSADVSPDDILPLVPLEEKIKAILKDKRLSIDTEIGGTLDDLTISRLKANMPRHIDLSASGRVASAAIPENISGRMKLDASFTDMGFIEAIFPDSLAALIAIPSRLGLHGTAALERGTYSADMALTTDTLGQISVTGSFAPGPESYQAHITAQDFPLYKFIPDRDLGYISFELTAEGAGFDMTADGASAQTSLYVDGLDLNNFYYDGIEAQASLNDHLVEGYIFGRNDALDIDMDISGEVRKGYYAAKLRGNAAMLDFQAMNLSPAPLAGSFTVDASVSAIPDSLIYNAEIRLDTVRVAYGTKLEKVDRTTINAVAGRTRTDAAVRSDDFTLDFSSPMPLAALLRSFTAVADTVLAQVKARDLDMERVTPVLPPLTLRARAGRFNVLGSLLRDKGYGFDSLTIAATGSAASPLNASIMLGGFRSGTFRTDTLTLNAGIDGSALDLRFKLANKPSRSHYMALIGIDGHVSHNTARVDIYQRDNQGNAGFDFGIEGELRDSSIYVSIPSLSPVFGYEKWRLNQGNYFEYGFDRSLDADMLFEGDGKHLYLRRAGVQDGVQAGWDGGINLNTEGIVLHDIFRMLPYPPPVEGVLSSDVDFHMVDSLMTVRGSAGLAGLTYNRVRLGNVGAQVDFGYGTDSLLRLNASATLDKKAVFNAAGTYTSSDMNLKLTVPSLPLAVVNAFIPSGTATLTGAVKGDIEISGNTSSPTINGGVEFVDAAVKTDMTATTFRISPKRIAIAHNVINFTGFSLTAPNNRPLNFNGSVDISNLSRMYTDLNLRATNFEVVNSTRAAGSPVYGRAAVDVDITARGAIYNLSVRGNVGILNNTDLVYTIQESSMGIENKRQEIVSFVSFAEADEMALLADTTATTRSNSLEVSVGIDIDDGVKATVNLSPNGNNRINLEGGGALSYSLDSYGDSRMAGRYTLSGGTVVYSPPVMSQKNFAIDNGSYVEWAGDPGDPSFNISAKDRVRTTVTMDDGTSGSVDFDIMVTIANTLQNMALAFDLAAPNDLTIQNQLASLAPEQRSQQALGLLVYNTYAGPGTSARVDSNNPLNSFIEQELNQWTRNNLRNVDLSFGIDSRSTASGSQYTDYSYKVSKSLFDDRVKVTVGGTIGSNNDPAAEQENFVDDISLEYRLSARDNMFARVYRYNTRESILEGEVTETGVGFLLRKKINSLKNLFSITRNPDRRRIRREIKDEVEADTENNSDEKAD